MDGARHPGRWRGDQLRRLLTTGSPAHRISEEPGRRLGRVLSRSDELSGSPEQTSGLKHEFFSDPCDPRVVLRRRPHRRGRGGRGHLQAAPDNGAGPLWCYGAPLVVRQGERVFVSVMETGEGVPPLSNTRWRLFEREEKGLEADPSARRLPPSRALPDCECGTRSVRPLGESLHRAAGNAIRPVRSAPAPVRHPQPEPVRPTCCVPLAAIGPFHRPFLPGHRRRRPAGRGPGS